ncbi:protein CYCLOPS-like isoform X2 [Populus alba x Populus x berolinensis]|nr:protein CYCLOPS-like isoform X2 [Populus alba x Populus x berolinensis]
MNYASNNYRISTELVNLTSQQHGSIPQKKRSNDVLFTQNNPIADDISNDLNQQSARNAAERMMPASNLYLAKTWFHSSQPMTRSRSSELRRRYVAMQCAQTNRGMEAMQDVSGHGVNNLKHEFGNRNGFNDPPMHDTANQLGLFMSPSNSSSSTFNTPQMSSIDKVSSVVNMLKGTLERKKLHSQIEKETVEDSLNAFFHSQEVIINSTSDQGIGNGIYEIPPGRFQEISSGQVKDPGVLQAVQGPIDLDFEGFVNTINPIQLGTVSREPSQSESSAAAPVVSSGFDACDGPSNSSQTLSVCESSRKQVGNGRSSENGSRAKVSKFVRASYISNADFRERIIDNLKDDRKKGGSSDMDPRLRQVQGDPTKKRRVERSRKMAEAKERNMTPTIPTDMQTILKRCENLEKEVRSLKLNLSFMNRKDSEQTKQIEELQKQNEEFD